MCLAMPAQITRLLPEKMAIVNLGGIEKEISLYLLDNIHVGDYVIVHVGYALTKLDETEALKTLQLMQEIQQSRAE